MHYFTMSSSGLLSVRQKSPGIQDKHVRRHVYFHECLLTFMEWIACDSWYTDHSRVAMTALCRSD